MIHRRKAGRAAAAVLAACLLFSACGPNLFQTQAEERPPVVHADVDFSTLEYTRPDLDALNAKIDTALEQVSAGDKEEETLALYDDILADISELDTMSAIAGIRYNIDLTDEYYEAEELALDEAYTRLDNRMNELTGAILESGYGKAARARWGDGFVERYEVNSKLNSPEIEELSIREQALVSEYQKLSATEYTAERDGEAVTLNDLDLTQESDIALYYAIYEKRNAELGQIYRELVQLRVEIAKKLGYDSYTDYAYDLLGRDFTKEDAAAFSEKVKEYLAPISDAIYNRYYSDIAAAQARTDVTFDDGIPVLEQALKNGGYPAAMSDALTYMLEHNLYSFGGGANKMAAGYTTLLNRYAAPYMFVNTDYYTDPGTLFHEFGHYYNFYLMGETLWNDGNNLDLAEIHSQGLEVLMFDTYEDMYGEDASYIEYAQLMNLVDSVLQGCAEDEFQQAVFEDPDMPLDEMNLLHAQIYQDYMGYPLVYEWVDIHHHFETPFYYVSYATSAVSALELWADALENRDKAMQIYDKLTQYTINVEYMETLKKVGLSDPFSSDCVQRVAQALNDEMQLSGKPRPPRPHDLYSATIPSYQKSRRGSPLQRGAAAAFLIPFSGPLQQLHLLGGVLAAQDSTCRGQRTHAVAVRVRQFQIGCAAHMDDGLVLFQRNNVHTCGILCLLRGHLGRTSPAACGLRWCKWQARIPRAGVPRTPAAICR